MPGPFYQIVQSQAQRVCVKWYNVRVQVVPRFLSTDRRDPSPNPKVAMSRKPYPSDLTDAQWSILEPLIPPAKPGGHPRTQNRREILNAIFYLVRNGCAW